MEGTESPVANADEGGAGVDADGSFGDGQPSAGNPNPENPDGLLDGGDSADGPPRGNVLVRVVGSVFLVIGLIFALWYPLPNSPVKQAVPSWWVGATEFLGLQQNWAMFYPDPPGETVAVEAVVTDASGKSVVVRSPFPNPIFGSVYSERWRKWQERIRPPIESAVASWPNAARWFAKQAEAAGMSDPVKVELRRSWVVSDLMGKSNDHSTHLFVFFIYDIKTGGATYLDAELNPAIRQQEQQQQQQQQQGGAPANGGPTSTAPGTTTPAPGTGGAPAAGDGATSTTAATTTTAVAPSGPAGANGANP